MSAGLLRIGFVADGVWKMLVGIAMFALFGSLVDKHGAPGELLVVTVVPVLASAVAEVVYAVRSGAVTHVKYLIAYDFGWVLTSAVALSATNVDVAWALWLGYQLVVSPIIVVVFVQGARRAESSVHASTHTDVAL